jgi:hypothetical protein
LKAQHVLSGTPLIIRSFGIINFITKLHPVDISTEIHLGMVKDCTVILGMARVDHKDGVTVHQNVLSDHAFVTKEH